MQLPRLWVFGAALAGALVAVVAGVMALSPPGELIRDAEFSLNRITPNADGNDDVTEFQYTLSQNADVSLIFTAEDGTSYAFREGNRRPAGDYRVLFSGVVDGFRMPEEDWQGDLQTRLLPDGIYTWTLTAMTDDGEQASTQGQLEIAEGDPDLPLISAFDVGPRVFSPNQDGLRDRISVNVFLEKAAQLEVYLEDQQGVRIYLPPRFGARDPGEPGNHEYDYDGGVDQGFRPPPDGDYTIFAVAQDDEGQRMVRTSEITIETSGLPQVEIVPQPTGGTVCFDTAPYDPAYFTDAETQGERIAHPESVCSELTTLSLLAGDLLVFHLAVSNYGDTPVRTAGPFPGTVYEFNQLRSSMGAYEEAGAWRVGLMCDTSESSYPWRWALGSLDELTEVYDAERDQTFYYLEPGARSEVWGAVRMTEIIDARNPQPCWAGLIHEQVGIPPRQNNVGAREIELLPNPEMSN
ncbi:MAG: hypothetical protein ACLFTK_07220 [Anaerolineales bacterium]